MLAICQCLLIVPLSHLSITSSAGQASCLLSRRPKISWREKLREGDRTVVFKPSSMDDQSALLPEQDGENEVVVESSSRKRFYECIFCKRGFTNAQALGGHMNIHRKDRQRIGNDSKRVHTSSSSRPHSSESKPYSLVRKTNNCPSKNLQSSFFDVQSFSPLRMNYEFLDANLCLRNCSVPEEDMDVAEVIKNDKHEEDEIDLELRLGYCRG